MDGLSGAEIAKPRSLKEFILGSANYKLPDSASKWNKRMLQNLLYYQTNYFQVIIVFMFLIGYLKPAKFFNGMACIIITSVAAYFGVNKRQELRSFQTNHPAGFLTLLFLLSYLLMYMFDLATVFLFAFLLPVFLCLIHSSIRTRNFGSQIESKLEEAGIRKTYMGVFLKYLDLISESIFD